MMLIKAILIIVFVIPLICAILLMALAVTWMQVQNENAPADAATSDRS